MASTPRRILAIATSLATSCLPVLPGGEEQDPIHATQVGASIAWIFSDDLDLVGRVKAHVPWRLGERRSLFFSFDAVSAIEKSLGDFTFVVRDLAYSAEIGSAWRLESGHLLSVHAGTQGLANVDDDGSAWIRHVGAAAGSAGFREPGPKGRPGRPALEWRASLGAVVDDHEIQADWLASADLRLDFCGEAPACVRGDLSASALRAGDRVRADFTVGPRLDLRTFHGGRMSLFGRYLRSRHPFGLRTRGILIGLEAEDLRPGRRLDLDGGTLLGRAALGAGDAREAARFKLLLLSPRWRERWRAVTDVDTNVLTAEDTRELYYLYHVGIERETGRALVGGYFFHRSNHRLAEPGATVTSLNVLEAGIETTGWDHRDAGGPLGQGPTWEGRFRAGYVLDSDFGERDRWRVRAGGRFLHGTAWGPSPFAEAEIEEGEVARRQYGLGIAFTPGADVRLEYRSDEQFYGRDRTALLLLATYAF